MASAFQDIKFGNAAAENEHHYLARLLEDAFLDDEDMVATLVRDLQYYVVLGPKGSGKSAIGYRLELLERRFNMNARVFRLDDFPFDGFSRIIDWPGETDEFIYRQNWEFLLGLCYWHIMQRDKTAISNTAFEPEKISNLLRALDLEAGTNVSAVTKTIVMRRAYFATGYGGAERATTQEHGVANLANLKISLADFCFKTVPSKPVRIILDGLDDNLAFVPGQLRCLTSLLLAVGKFNAELTLNGIDAKIIVLCRDDVWQAMQSNNLQRIRDDNALEIAWYEEGKTPEDSRLVRLMNLRASHSLARSVNVARDFLPKRVGWASGWGPTLRVLLDHTRHVPRDLVNILNAVQDNMGVNEVRPTEDQIRLALKKYCDNHFEGEIRNTLRGLLPDDQIPVAMDLLAAIPKQEFSPDEALAWAKKSRGDDVTSPEVYRLLSALYAACAIGQTWLDDAGHRRLAFRYRNPSSRFNPKFHVYVHPALFKAIHGDIMGYVYHPMQDLLELPKQKGTEDGRTTHVQPGPPSS